jgi:DNA-binding NarL/FixJ family response regulator
VYDSGAHGALGGRPLTLLVVSDDAVVREGLKACVHRSVSVCEVFEAADTPGAERLARDHSPGLVVVDAAVAPAGGLDLVRSLRAAKLHARVVLVSYMFTPGQVARARELDVGALVTRRASVATLCKAIAAAVRGCGFVDPALALETLLPERPCTSERELQVMHLLLEGLSPAQIAQRLQIREKRVRAHVIELIERVNPLDLRHVLSAGLRTSSPGLAEPR